MPRHRKHLRTRGRRLNMTNRTRRTQRRATRKHKQRGGAHKDDLIELITSANNFDQILGFFQGMEAPIYNHQFPRKDGETYVALIVEGEVANNAAPQKMLTITMRKQDGSFNEVILESSGAGVPQDYLNQFRGELLNPASDEYRGIVGATQELFGVGA